MPTIVSAGPWPKLGAQPRTPTWLSWDQAFWAASHLLPSRIHISREPQWAVRAGTQTLAFQTETGHPNQPSQLFLLGWYAASSWCYLPPFPNIEQKWKYPIVKTRIPQWILEKRHVYILSLPLPPSSPTRSAAAAVTGSMCDLVARPRPQQIPASPRLLPGRGTHRSESCWLERFHLKQIHFSAVSESSLNNWVVLIELTAFWSLY